ncbi:MAG: ABC transporter substrate-binding protein [Rhizobiales bacterium]|nr:ABC transporter substrate-binding protein [Hyphomicrobiales bacterium]
MRHVDFARRLTCIWLITLGFLVPPALAFEIEGERLFSGARAEITLSVLSTTDTDIIAPLIEAFLDRNPGVAIRYVTASSQEVFHAIADEGAAYDLVISSAMDLQMKLANDGFAAAHASPTVASLPDWARWRDRLFGFALERVVVMASRKGLGGLEPPRTRRALIDLLRDNPDRFQGKIGTYDPVLSGTGYLFASQDARQTDTFWRLAEVMGRLNARLYCCSGDMIRDLGSGKLIIAYNVVGSYAAARLSANPDAMLIEMEDLTVALLRTAFIPNTAPNPELGGRFLDFLISREGQRLTAGGGGFPILADAGLDAAPYVRPIRLDPGLLVYLDRIKRQDFLAEWAAAMQQL